MAFQLIAGHAALDFVNTLDWRFGNKGPQDLLAGYSDLLRFAQQSKLAIPKPRAAPGAGSRVFKRCIELREALAEVFYARIDGREAPPAARHTLERYFKEARLRQPLKWKKSPRLEWGWPERQSDAERPLWALALSAADLMTSDAVDRVRACDNPECRWLFLDTSKNHSRRWCEMKLCGNRMKARRFKAREKQPREG
jgi:predicted RNA-binding Zn ribbon-like protein